ncbi:MAG: hypothetical protein A2W99_01560 [Bacteroidetes bacterium GWF2_33_16]|nr:MAG: hypothetical protein A2X00_16595 [Bacteroidetes bacterium GWE2_32_14]OFY06958.1 MAG: hypothetical protein A2W99_01560 [Bacteroidetes bacterium GWF2_33_16]
MKKINVTFINIVLAIFSIAFISCDDEETVKENNFKYDGKTYKIAKGLLENYGIGDGKDITSVYEVDLTFLTKEFTLNELTGDISGTGSYIYLWFLSTSGTQLTTGTYTFNNTLGTAGTFYYGEIAINAAFFTDLGYIEIVAGTVKVKLNDTKYEITIDCTLSDNKKLTGYYKGNLVYIDYSEVKSAKDKIRKM